VIIGLYPISSSIMEPFHLFPGRGPLSGCTIVNSRSVSEPGEYSRWRGSI